MTKLAIIIAALLFLSKPIVSNECDSYFKFDNIEHLKYEKSYSYNNLRKVNKSHSDLTLEEILIRDTSNSLSDSTILLKAEQLGFHKKSLNGDQFDNINKILCSEDNNPNETTFCDPVYNDILIFRNKGTIVGFSKICLGCYRGIIVGKEIQIDKIFRKEVIIALKQIIN